MGTEILRPQDCFIERIRVSPCRRRNYYYGNGNFNAPNPNNNNNFNARFNRKPAIRSERPDHQRKRSSEPSISKRSSSGDESSKISRSQSHQPGSGNNNNLVMEKVTILRRGESLDSKIKSIEGTPASAALKKEQIGSAGDLVVTGTDRLGPDPEMVLKPARIVDLRSPVAGSCNMYAGSAFAVSPAPSSLPLPSFSKKKQLPVDDSATRDLRRLLRLDF